MRIRQHKIHSAHPKQINLADRLHRIKYMILIYNLFIERLPTQIINIAILDIIPQKVGNFPSPMGCRETCLCRILASPKLDPTAAARPLASPWSEWCHDRFDDACPH
jgi:hypothetical protein